MYTKHIEAYHPQNEKEKVEKEVILKYIERFPDTILHRTNTFAHLTSSGFIINKTCDKVLMIYHRIYQSWAWTGGHADGEENLLAVALKEAEEETGLNEFEPLTGTIDCMDILPVWGHDKKGQYVATHMHLNVSYILIADDRMPLKVNTEETEGVRWIKIDELDDYCNEPEILPIYKGLIKKARTILNQ